MEIRRVTLEQLHPHPRNPRSIDSEAFDGLKTSIQNFGYVGPILWNSPIRAGGLDHQRM